MCKFFSAIVGYKHNKLYWDLNLDSHTDILEKFKIADDKLEANFVKIEYTQNRNDVFDHNLDNWTLTVDQDNVPEWYDKDVALRMCKEAISEVFRERFLIDVKDDRIIKTGRWWLKNSRAELYGSSSAVLRESSRAVLRESSRAVLYGSSNAMLRESSLAVL